MSTRFLSSFLLVALLAAPTGVFSAVEISEIMYDLPGSDEGREWIELHNTGPDSTDIAGWKLFEEGVNHRLTYETSSVIPAGGYAVIADDISKFRADWPGYGGMLISSSFSLKNTGETIGIKNASSTIIFSSSYGQDSGADGNGNTLNLIGSSITERSPSPGTIASSAALPKAAVQETRNSAPSKRVQKDDSAEPLSGDAGAVSIPESGQVAGISASFQDGVSSGMIPWILALLCVILLGCSAIFFVKKKPGSGYRIIEENDG